MNAGNTWYIANGGDGFNKFVECRKWRLSQEVCCCKITCASTQWKFLRGNTIRGKIMIYLHKIFNCWIDQISTLDLEPLTVHTKNGFSHNPSRRLRFLPHTHELWKRFGRHQGTFLISHDVVWWHKKIRAQNYLCTKV